MAVDDAGAARLGVLFAHVLQLGDDDLLHARRTGENILQILDLVLQGARLLHALEDIFLVDVAQLDLRDILRLHLVDAEADHQVRHHVGLGLRLADDLDRLVDVEQDALETLQKVQLVLLFAHDEVDAAADAFRAPRAPLVEQLAHAHHARHSGDEHVEVAGHGILQRRGLHQLLHELVGIGAALEVDGQLETVEVGLVAHIGDLLDLACLDQLGDLVHDGLGRGGVGDLIDLDEVFLFVVAPAGADLHAAAARAVNFAQGVDVADDLAAGREIGRKQRLCQVAVGILEVGDRRVAHLAEVEAAQLARHAGNALIGAHEDVREGRRQQRRLLHGVVVVVDEIDGIGVDVAEQLGADGGELGLRVAARRPRHVARVDLTEVALGVHERVQQRTVALGKAHHRVIDGDVAVGIEPHGLTDDVRALRARAVQQSHLIHGIEELAVAGLKAVDLRNGTRDDDRHRVGHIVRLQRIGDALFDHVRTQAEDVGVIAVLGGGFLLFVLLHGVPRTFTYSVIMDYISFSARRQCVGAAQSVVCSLPHCTKGANVFRVSWLKSHLAFSSPVLYHLQKKQTREDTAMTQYVYKKKFLPAGVSIFISTVFVDNDIVSFDR